MNTYFGIGVRNLRKCIRIHVWVSAITTGEVPNGEKKRGVCDVPGDIVHQRRRSGLAEELPV